MRWQRRKHAVRRKPLCSCSNNDSQTRPKCKTQTKDLNCRPNHTKGSSSPENTTDHDGGDLPRCERTWKDANHTIPMKQLDTRDNTPFSSACSIQLELKDFSECMGNGYLPHPLPRRSYVTSNPALRVAVASMASNPVYAVVPLMPAFKGAPDTHT